MHIEEGKNLVTAVQHTTRVRSCWRDRISVIDVVAIRCFSRRPVMKLGGVALPPYSDQSLFGHGQSQSHSCELARYLVSKV
jgi:hypothetical protein